MSRPRGPAQRARARQRWEDAGRPEGQDLNFQAERELADNEMID
ncbi:DUF2934 domain-containing protein [Bradyrhizobium sp. I1.14.4]